MKANKTLLIVEGAVAEPEILKTVFDKYGVSTYHAEKRLEIGDDGDIALPNLKDDTSDIVIVQGPRTRLYELLKIIKNHSYDVNKMMGRCSNYFSLIFWVFDVDQNTDDELSECFKLFMDESDDGLLLLSCPCVESLADDQLIEFECDEVKKYKAEINRRLSKNHEEEAYKFIKKNFDTLVIKVLDRNVRDFNSRNVMEHPSLILPLVKRNIRNKTTDKNELIFRYFSTVIYVLVACSLGLTRNMDNYEEVRSFFEKNASKASLE